MDLSSLTKLVDSGKVGGWVRAGVASGLTALIAKWPGLSQYLDPATQAALGAAISGIAVDIWSHIAKTGSGS